MGIVIDNPEIIEQIELLSSRSGKSAAEVIAEAIESRHPRRAGGPLKGERLSAAERAVREAQAFFRTHRDPADARTPDEIIGYDEHGLPR